MTQNNFLHKAKQDGQIFVKTVGLMAKLGKFKLDIRSRQTQMSRLLKTVGHEVFEIYYNNKRKSKKITTFDSIAHELSEIERLELEIAQLQAQSEQAKREFRGESGAVDS